MPLDQAPRISPPTPRTPAGGAPTRVLVVDDNPEMRAYMRQCLEQLPIRIEEAVDGADALARLRSDGNVALVITDLLMPGLDGLALKEALHAEAQWTDVPVLLITGEAIQAQYQPFLRKPFNARRLRAAVQSLLDGPSHDP